MGYSRIRIMSQWITLTIFFLSGSHCLAGFCICTHVPVFLFASVHKLMSCNMSHITCDVISAYVECSVICNILHYFQ